MVFVKDFKGQTDTDYIADFSDKQLAIDYVRKHEEHFRRQARTWKVDSDVAVRMEIEEWVLDEDEPIEEIEIVYMYELWAKPISLYQRDKESARQKAIDYQIMSSDWNMSYQELAHWTNYFEKLGKRYGLIKEFKENGII